MANYISNIISTIARLHSFLIFPLLCFSWFVSQQTSAATFVDPDASDQELARELAPVLYIHPDDPYMPMSMEYFYRNSVLKAENGIALKANPANVNELVSYSNSESDYLDLDDEARFGNSDLSNTPIYAHVVRVGEYREVQYAVLQGMSGCQTFRAKFTRWWRSKKRNFIWCSFGRHEGDWEHVTVRTNAETGEVLGVFTAAHGDETWHAYNDVKWQNGLHPEIYIALNTHAFFVREGTFTTAAVIDSDWGWLLRFASVSVDWLKTVDATTSRELVGHNGQSFKVWNSAGNVEMLNDDSPITEFLGRWGVRAMDNSRVQDPEGDLPYIKDQDLQNVGQFAMDQGILDQFKTGGSPTPPWRKYWWDGSHTKP